ncbi:hypothetical protein BDQ17DRAFT_1264972, partial [Cyathus striatus]
DELQELEITALKAIYGDDFVDCPPPKAWKVRCLLFYVCVVIGVEETIECYAITRIHNTHCAS